MSLEYECPNCDETLKGCFGEDVYCKVCQKVYETDWEYSSYDSIVCWITKEKET